MPIVNSLSQANEPMMKESAMFLLKKSLSNAQPIRCFPLVEASKIILITENSLLLFNIDSEGRTEIVHSLYLGSGIHDALLFRQEIAKVPVDFVLFLTNEKYGLLQLRENQFDLVKEFHQLGPFNNYLEPLLIIPDPKSRIICFQSLEKNLHIFKLKRKFDTKSELTDCFESVQLIESPNECIWKVLILKCSKLTLVSIRAHTGREESQFFLTVYQHPSGGSEFKVAFRLDTPKDSGAPLHLLQHPYADDSFFLVTETCICTYFLEDVCCLRKVQRMKDYLGNILSSSLMATFLHWKEGDYLVGTTKGDLILASLERERELFTCKPIRKIESPTIFTLFGNAFLLVVGDQCDGCIYGLDSGKSFPRVKTFAYNMCPITDCKSFGSNSLIISCGLETNSSLRKITKGIPTVLSPFSDAVFVGSTGIWSFKHAEEQLLFVGFPMSALLLIYVEEGLFEDIACNFPVAQDEQTILPIIFGSIFIQVCRRQIVIFELFAGGKVLFQVEFDEPITNASCNGPFLAISLGDLKVNVFNLNGLQICAQFFVSHPISCMIWNHNSLICALWSGELFTWNLKSNDDLVKIMDLNQGEKEEIPNSLVMFEGFLFCATRNGTIHRIQIEAESGVASKKTVHLCENPVSIVNCNQTFFLAVSTLTGEVWRVINFAQGFYFENIVMETKCRHLCAFTSSPWTIASIARNGSLVLSSISEWRSYSVEKMPIGKTVRRMEHYLDDEGSSTVFCYANDSDHQNGIIRGFETNKFSEIFRLKTKGSITAFHLIMEGTKKFLVLATKSLETLKVKLQILTINYKITSSPQLFYSSPTIPTSGSSSVSFENSSILSSTYAEAEEFVENISCIKSTQIDSVLFVIISEGKHLRAIEFPENSPKTFSGVDVATFSCRNFITCIEIDPQNSIIFIADSRDGIFALRLNPEEQKFDLLCCWPKIRLTSDLLLLNGFIYCLDKMGNLSILSFANGEFKEVGKCYIEELPIRMTRLQVQPTPASLQPQEIHSLNQIVFGTAAGNLWSISQFASPEGFYSSASPTDTIVNRELLCREKDYWLGLLGWSNF